MKYTVHLKDDSYPITIERNAIQKIAFINNVRMHLSYVLNKEKHPSALPLMNPY